MRYPTGHTHIYGILGDPIAHVRAPEFLNPMMEAAGLDGFVVPFHVLPADIGSFVPDLVRLRNLRGFIVTIPHKPAMARLCQRLERAAALTGTANTVRIEPDGTLTGDMFDGLGLVEGARAHDMDPRGRSVLVLGCGGAGRAIAFAMPDAGARSLTLWNRSAQAAHDLRDDIARAFPGFDVRVGEASAQGQDLVVQCTSLGLHAEDPLPMDPSSFGPDSRLFDIIAVRDTELMAASAARGARVVGGRPMVEHQAAAQFAFLGPPPLT
ncbi:MAG: shikimate dehydrogenase [Geminicoccaceae bacterium]|nr:shikimate dehydrogenase [Geminicoccaceae bacterium]MCB9944484.1 shikimate dehydrogenase [Geminicoccaceae bacterium]